jgi:hypothetical protein
MAPQSTSKRSNGDKKHITKFMTKSISTIIDFGVQNDPKMEPKSNPATIMQWRLFFLGPKSSPESPPRSTWTSFWASFGPPGPHFFEEIRDCRMHFAEMFEKTHVFGIPKPFRTHFKSRSI